MVKEEVIVRRGLAKKHAAVDFEVWQWKTKLEQERGVQRVTKAEVKCYAVEAYNRAGITDFKASDGWYRRWRVRWQLPDVVRAVQSKTNCPEIKANEESIRSCELNIHTNLKTVKSELTTKRKKSYCKEKVSSKRNKDIYKAHNAINNPTVYVKENCQRVSEFESKTIDKNYKTEYTNILQCEDHFLDPSHDSDFPNMLGLVRVRNSKKSYKHETEIACIPKTLATLSNEDVPECNLDMNTSDLSVETSFNTNYPIPSETSKTKSSISGFEGQSKLSQFQMVATKNGAFIETEPNEIKYHSKNVQQTQLSASDLLDEGSKLSKDTIFSKEHLDQLEKEDIGKTNEHNSLSICKTLAKNINSSLQKAINNYSQSDVKIPPLLTNAGIETPFVITSPIFDQNDLNFGDHEVYCESCEDFHPWQQSCQAHCSKLRKTTADNSLLSCVYEKRSLNILTSSNMDITSAEDCTERAGNSVEPVDVRLKNPMAVIPKGKRYLMQFKCKVVNYALNHSVKQTVSKFKVNRGTVSEWLAERKRDSCNSPNKLITYQEKSSSCDAEFLDWLESSKFNLTNELIRQKVNEWLMSERAATNKCHWLHLYAHRLNGTVDPSVKKRYIVYPEAFKRVAVFHAQTHSNLAASRVFGVARRRILDWLNISGNTKERVRNRTAHNVTDDSVDKQVLQWYCSHEPTPSSKQVRCKAVELYRVAGHQRIQCGAHWYYRWRARHKLPPARSQLYSDTRLLSWVLTRLDNNQLVTHADLAACASTLTHTKVSRGWTFRFCKKHDKLLAAVPEPTTPLPPDMELLVSSYRQALALHHFTDSHIIAMDQVPLHFLPKDQKQKPQLVRRPGFESCQAMLIVSSLSDGSLLPSMFIFKGVAPTCRSDPQVISVVNESGLITAEIMEEWLARVCFKQLHFSGGLLITDCYEVHTTEEIQQALVKYKVQHAVIPGGCAFKLLPIIQLCQTFKSTLEEMCHECLANQTEALHSPTPNQLYQWMVRIHKHLAKQEKVNIQTAFKEMLFQPLGAV